MPSTNGHGAKSAILYSRVSTDEQARTGYSLAQQLEALREYATREGYEVVEEVQDAGQSGAMLARPGLDRVRDLVQAGGVSVVLAQDRDRFAREPAYLYLLRRELEEYGAKLKALNDRGDETPEGELTDGILDQLAKFERAKIAERTRRGKLRKTREGKVVAGRRVKFGFKLNAARDGYEVDEEKMAVVRRIFDMIGARGYSQNRIFRTLTREGVPTPGGGKHWDRTYFRECVLDDAYKPHTYEEISQLVAPSVAAGLEKTKRYGVLWSNRYRVRTEQVSEASHNGEKRYRIKKHRTLKPREEWIAVPVPDAGIPRELVEAARSAIKENRASSTAGHRFWQLSGGIARCGLCGKRMENRHITSDRTRFYHLCRTHHVYKDAGCTHRKNHRVEPLEATVWEFVSGLLSDPDRLRQGLEEMIATERAAYLRGDPKEEERRWLEKLSKVEQERRGYLRLAAKGLITDEELGDELASLEETQKTAESELGSLHKRRETIEELERDRDSLLEHYAKMVPQELESLTPEERHEIYRMLRLEAYIFPDGSLELHGVLRDGSLHSEGNTLKNPQRPKPKPPIRIRGGPSPWMS
jgi:site-specific DNA recombinase